MGVSSVDLGSVVSLYLYAILVLIALPLASHAEFSLGTPSQSRVAACEEYSSSVLNNPWDMSDSADVNNYFKDLDITGLESMRFSGDGTFAFSTDSNGDDSWFYLWSPRVCQTHPVGGRWGAELERNVASAVKIDSAAASKYSHLSVRMRHSAIADSTGGELRLRWDRGCSYNNSVTFAAPTRIIEGWHTYVIDLANAELAGNSNSWTQGEVTGLAIEPSSINGAQVEIDWVRLDNRSSCSSLGVNIPYVSTSAGQNDLVAFFLDDDSDPFNGYVKHLGTTEASGSSSYSIPDLVGVAPGQYGISAARDSDYATLELTDPWDMDSIRDVANLGAIDAASFSNGVFSGSTASADSVIVLPLGSTGIDASRYHNLSIKLTLSSFTQPIQLFWDGGSAHVLPADHVGGNVYNLDLTGNQFWTGNITDLTLRVQPVSNVQFAIDFVSIRSSGFDGSRSATAANVTASAATLTVNAPPQVDLFQPDHKGGAAWRPWNMNRGDMALLRELIDGNDASHPGEALTAFLPDVRLVSGVRGDFFKGTNTAGVGDPTNYSIFPTSSDVLLSFSAAQYKNLCFKLFIDQEFSLLLGSSIRVIWRRQDTGQFYGSEDIVAITDRWTGSPWYEYCLDLTTLPLEETLDTSQWAGTIDGFRIDPHEFNHDRLNDDLSLAPGAVPISATYYFDYIKLRANDRAQQRFALVYRVSDSDESTPSASFYYNQVRSTEGGTKINSSDLDCEGEVCVWNASAVANGTYYLYAQASDSTSTAATLASGALVVDNSAAAPNQAPILSLESPSAERNSVCGSLQVKGFTLQPDRYEDVVAVQVFVDGAFFARLTPGLYSPQAKSLYPGLDSSNSGFNQFFDFSQFAGGTHQIEVKAYSSDGTSASSGIVTINAQADSCSPALSDPDPAGVVVPAELDSGQSRTSAPKLGRAVLKKKGSFKFLVGKIGKAKQKCKISVYAGIDPLDVNHLIKRWSIRKLDERAKKLLFKAKRLKVDGAAIPRFYMRTEKTCRGMLSQTSAIRTINVKSQAKGKNKGAATFAELLTTLRKQLKRSRLRSRAGHRS